MFLLSFFLVFSFRKVYRDVMMVLSINITFAQIGGSLPSVMPSVPWPAIYVTWLQQMSFVNLDVLSLFGFSCLVKVGYEARFMATAFVVVLIVAVVWVSYQYQRHRLKKSHESKIILPVEIQIAAETLFDMMDRESGRQMDVPQFQDLLVYMSSSKQAVHSITLEKTQKVMEKQFGSSKVVRRSAFVRAVVAGKLNDAASNNIEETANPHGWVEKQQLGRKRTSYVSGLVQVLLIFHAPVSQKVFYYFNVERLNGRSFLRDDMSLEMWSARWTTFLPVVLLFLVGFTLALPLFITFSLLSSWRDLHTPRVMSKFGFLYARFNTGAELWEVHEIFRKTFLCGLIVYFTPQSKATVAILVCVMAVASVHFFRPPRNNLVRRVLQVEIICTTFKYLGAVLMLSGDKDQTEDFIGVVLVALDVFVMVFSLISGALILWNISDKVKRMSVVVIPAGGGGGGGGGGNETDVCAKDEGKKDEESEVVEDQSKSP